jgi:hypothetical protein
MHDDAKSIRRQASRGRGNGGRDEARQGPSAFCWDACVSPGVLPKPHESPKSATPDARRCDPSAAGACRQGRMNSRQQPHEVRLRGLAGVGMERVWWAWQGGVRPLAGIAVRPLPRRSLSFQRRRRGILTTGYKTSFGGGRYAFSKCSGSKCFRARPGSADVAGPVRRGGGRRARRSRYDTSPGCW